VLGRPRRLAILAEGQFGPLDAKTAVGVLRYAPGEVAAVIDSTRAGATTQSVVGVGGATPVVRDVEAAARLGADALLIGIAPQGGSLPGAWRPIVLAALARGWDVLSGLHAFLADDPEFAARAAASGARLHDVRRPPGDLPVASAKAAALDALVVLTVGSDCNVGKMTAGLEIVRGLDARGVRAAFVATGQTGIFIAGRGVAIDAVPSDFAAGAIEALVVEAAAGADVVVVEGQGSLFHPGYSGVTLALLHGACPAAMVLCHEASRDAIRRSGEGDRATFPLPAWEGLIEAYERAAAWVEPAAVIAVALNTRALDEPRARAACDAAARATRRPATDPVRFGAAPLVDAVLDARAARERRRASPAGGTRATAP
jgi:uncharacterized NAD-dependent epimerase/dehydratase family protein